MQTFVGDILADGGFEITTVRSAEEAHAVLQEAVHYRAPVTDISLGRDIMDGWQLAAPSEKCIQIFW